MSKTIFFKLFIQKLNNKKEKKKPNNNSELIHLKCMKKSTKTAVNKKVKILRKNINPA